MAGPFRLIYNIREERGLEKHFAVIGDPIAHSHSPEMHRAGFYVLSLEAEYQRFQVHTSNLKEAVDGLKALGFTGWNVTIPHKEKMAELVDELTAEAKRAGAVNTVKHTGGRLIGHNTDGLGLVRSLGVDEKSLAGKEAVILGAGGAARGIAPALAERGMHLKILNRTPERAWELAEGIRAWGGEAVGGELAPGAWLESAFLIVQTTSLGLHGEPYPFPLQGIRPDAIVVDIIFNPWETPFLSEAKVRGCQVQNGLGMLLHQGALAWEFWWDSAAPLEAMDQGLRAAVAGRTVSDERKTKQGADPD